MNSFLIISLGLIAIASAGPASDGVYIEYLRRGGIQCRSNCRSSVRPHQDCPIVNCPPAVRDGQCGVPDCTLQGNLLRLHPHPDPNFYYQCRRADDWGRVEALVRPCGCGTVFSARVDETRCVHPEEWLPDCSRHPNRWQDIILSRAQCRAECETCDDNGNDPPSGDTTPFPPVTPPPGGDNNCQCPCVCIWFPCQPCQNNCACNGNNNRNNNNRNPIINRPTIPMPQPPQWQPIQPPQPPQWQPNPDPWNPTNPWNPQPEQRDPWNPRQPIQQPQPPQWNPQPEQRDPWNPSHPNPEHPWNRDQWNNQPRNPWEIQQPVQPIQPLQPWDRQQPQWFAEKKVEEAKSEEDVKVPEKETE